MNSKAMLSLACSYSYELKASVSVAAPEWEVAFLCQWLSQVVWKQQHPYTSIVLHALRSLVCVLLVDAVFVSQQ